ncbi:hypothetical protein HOP62_20555 [Halomonas sp. MCCC 1A17488]|uniref:hypothetical protein n=1 Tax=unclassified Halomonas TaxID=2609666 RepID=UPI0018D26206|nr:MULTISPECIES: hypothetical protein [unclassified Halomonas]MCE8018475.1 hypothetical protein [Halomonas sp. MCCC 1A17488]MCG3241808.1 hypothetical protein [Halomonas sp. MCCC 1A17488]QPP49175.1 hypothetical protein I4484_18645 [Halomonas sp. SS10-MC5]
MSLIGSRRRALPRGATRRRQPGRGRHDRFDRWLDRAVDIAVFTALTVGGVALVLHLLL